MKTSKGKGVKFYYPPNTLREKVGIGGIDPKRLEKGEDYIDNNELDFLPYAVKIMNRLEKLIAEARGNSDKGKKTIDRLVQPIMELKANGGMFRYRLVSEIAEVVLSFLENVKTLDADCFDIIDAHQTALQVIINNKLKGDGGKEGRVLAEELRKATTRYYKKHNIKE